MLCYQAENIFFPGQLLVIGLFSFGAGAVQNCSDQSISTRATQTTLCTISASSGHLIKMNAHYKYF